MKTIISLFCIIFYVNTASINAQTNLNPTTPAQIDPGIIGNGDWNGDEYFFTNAITLPSLPDRNIDLRGYVTLPRGVKGPFPLVILLHGRHNICYTRVGTSGFLTTDCGDQFGLQSNEIPNFRGFRYLANTLVTHGYVVATIDANAIIDAVERDKQAATINGEVVPQLLKIKDEGAQLRAELIQEHLDFLSFINDHSTFQIADVPTRNTMDFDNVITMGHSRGGEGVVKHFIHNQNLGSPYTIKGVFAVAPTNANNFIVPKGMNYSVMIPYCDGDLTNTPGIWAYDRQTENSDASTHQILLMGANHNNFNALWTPGGFPAGTYDDWENFQNNFGSVGAFCGNSNNRFPPGKQRNVLNTYLHSFIKTYVNNDFRYADPILGINNYIPASTQLGNNEVHVSYQAPKGKRMDLNIVKNGNTEYNNFTSVGSDSFDICGTSNEEYLCGDFNNDIDKRLDDHYSPEHQTGLARLKVSWENTDRSAMRYYVDRDQKNVQPFTHFRFRAGVTAFPPFQINRVGGNQNFTVTIVDRHLNRSSTEIALHSNALYPPLGTMGNVTPRNIANTIAIPLDAFKAIDLKNIRIIEFEFDKTNKGEIYFTDFGFTHYGEGEVIIEEEEEQYNWSDYITSNTYQSQYSFDRPIKVYPNPARDHVNITASSPITNIQIQDLRGETILSKSDINNQNQFQMNTSNLPRGIYIITVNQEHPKRLVIL